MREEIRDEGRRKKESTDWKAKEGRAKEVKEGE
jgi:hypothetical protein